MARVWLPPQSDPWLALREPALLAPNRLPIGNAVLRRDGLARGLTACFVADGGTLREVIGGVSPSADTASGSRAILGALGPEYSGASGVNTRFAGEARFAPVNGTGLTIAAWFDVDTLTNYSAIAAFQQTTTTDGWELRLGGAGGVTGSDINFAQFNGVGVRAWRSGANRYSAGQRQAYIACSRDGQQIQTAPLIHWGTGSAVASASVGGAVGDMTVPASRELYVGHRYDNVTRLDGAVGMLLIYDRALSAAELDALYARGPAALFELAANEPIFIGTAAGGPATITGTGALAAGAASVAGTAERELTATGALSSQAAAVAGTGTVSGVVTGTGVLAAQAATVAGTAERELTATGALSAQTAAVAGTAEREITGTGAPASTAATMAGTGTVTSPGVHTGTGALAAQAATMTGAGILARDGTGVLAAGVATINATGIIARDATGALAAQAAAIAGTGTVSVPGVVTGTGVLAGLSAAVSGTGTVQTPDGWTPVPSAGGTWSDIAAATSTWTEI